jgi:6-phosphogluconolactonase
VTTSSAREVRTFPDLEFLSGAAADEIVAIATASIAARGRFAVALAGGNTPRRTYELLATRHRDAIDWARTDIVFGDERFVPADDSRSNERMARESLLDRVPVPQERVHAVPTTVATAAAAAAAYGETLKRVAPEGVDLVLLGVGPDGHTASLFPGSPAIAESDRFAVAVAAPTVVQPAVPRVTTTLPFLNGARVAMFLIAGADKRPVIGEILAGAETARRYPAAMIASRERTIWMIDRSALPDQRPDT